MTTPVILSGGTGSRLWPLSRSDNPKQFLNLHGDAPMIVETARRTRGDGFNDPIIVAGEAHRFHAAAAMADAEISLSALILEPAARSTAPAIALAAHLVNRQDPDGLILCCPADHVITDPGVLLSAIEEAKQAAQEGYLVTFGIAPDRPETGFGYVEQGDQLSQSAVHVVRSFVEKPDRAGAEAMLENGGFLWNAGIFLMKASTYLEELKAFEPEIYSASAAAMDDAINDMDFIRPSIPAFKACPNVSIDYAVMERTDKAAVIPVALNWSDIGSWDAMLKLGDKDSDGNVLLGDVVGHGMENSYVNAQSRLVACVGTRDLAIVETPDAVLVADRSVTQNVKHIFDQLKAQGRREAVHHTRVERPWGSFETLALGQRFQVKRIIVKQGGTLSLQKHHHRSEHWVVVEGTARVTVGSEARLLAENESVYIPLGEVHRLENPGKVPVVLIEVQTGTYLGEDDIIRLEDIYNREAVPADASAS
ncbi:MAG: mannose-1-phosphate guanylyltransferase/mannose-6-phosphate isomerase [Pseudomonadota bacterium]